jgi:hypothetical protein
VKQESNGHTALGEQRFSPILYLTLYSVQIDTNQHIRTPSSSTHLNIGEREMTNIGVVANLRHRLTPFSFSSLLPARIARNVAALQVPIRFHWRDDQKRTSRLTAAGAVTALFLGTNVISQSIAQCHDTELQPCFDENPLWPNGITEKDVDELVNQCMNDPTINIRAVPDHLERQIYKSTIKLTFNTVYWGLHYLHGVELLGHAVQINRHRQPVESLLPTGESPPSLLLQTSGRFSSSLNELYLEEVADRMLANRNVNMTLVPDFVERQLYVNCLKLVFRVLDMLTASFRVRLCGHEFTIRLQQASNPELTPGAGAADQLTILQQSALKVSAGPGLLASDVRSAAIIKSFANYAGVVDDVEAVTRPTNAPSQDNETAVEKPSRWQFAKELTSSLLRERTAGLWDQVLYITGLAAHPRNAFVQQLHASLYALILGIIDDVLANTEIEVLSDRISFDIRPLSTSLQEESLPSEAEINSGSDQGGVSQEPGSSGSSANDRKSSSNLRETMLFVAGMGTGCVVCIALALWNGRLQR